MEELDIVKGECVDLNHEGLGVVKIDGFPVFVTDLLVGEPAKIKITKVNKNYALGEVIGKYQSSPDRVNPICKSFSTCGGCDLMHMNYDAQLCFKLKMVNETFKRIGHLDYEVKEIIGANNPYEYRNKVQIPYKYDKIKKKIICGFYQKKSHNLVEFDKCYIQSDLTTDISRFVRNLLNELKIPTYDEVANRGIFRHLLVRKTYDDNYMVVFICKERTFKGIEQITEKIKLRYPQVKSIIINYNPSLKNTIIGEEYKVLYGLDSLEESILGLKFNLSHKSFFQINHEQTEKLYQKVLDFANINEASTVLDCYCGVGTISLLFSKYVKEVYGVEVVKDAIKNAKQNARINKSQIKASKVEFIVGKAEEVLNELIEKTNIDLIVCDPPRKGMEDNMIEGILSSNIKEMIYVSCDCGTLARDLCKLTLKYKIKSSCCVDLFPQTADVETIVKLERM